MLSCGDYGKLYSFAREETTWTVLRFLLPACAGRGGADVSVAWSAEAQRRDARRVYAATRAPATHMGRVDRVDRLGVHPTRAGYAVFRVHPERRNGSGVFHEPRGDGDGACPQ